MKQDENSEELHRKSCWIAVPAKIYYAVSVHNTGVTLINWAYLRLSICTFKHHSNFPDL